MRVQTNMSDEISIDEEELNNTIYHLYQKYTQYYELTHSETLMAMDFGDYLIFNLFHFIKKNKN